MRYLICFSAVGLILSFPTYGQVPAAPISSQQVAAESSIIKSIQSNDVDTYKKLLAPNVKVYEDGNLLASDRAVWLNIFGKKLSTNGVNFKIIKSYEASGRLLTIEYFNSAGSWGGEIPSHCCWRYDAVAYDIKSGIVTSIYRIRGGDKEQ